MTDLTSSLNRGPLRVASIDVLRALTMMLMIFVNDLWSLKEIPHWLEHVEYSVDGIGLADIVFPAFLFIVGLSIPFSTDNRRVKGETTGALVWHVLVRTVALLTMGVFLVNGETYNEVATGMPKVFWNPLCCLSFILLWNSYPSTVSKSLVWGAKVLGVFILIVLAYIYRGGEQENLELFSPQWWGILGLIGWAYLASALITVFAKNSFYAMILAWVFFCALSMVYSADLLPPVFSFIPNAISGGTLTGLTLGGVLTAMIFKYYKSRGDNTRLVVVLLIISTVLIGLSVVTRSYWGLSKLRATPAWLFLCSAITILAFLVSYWLVDVKRKERWFDVVKPAGTDTLLCYLIPYFAYATTALLGIHLPEIILLGGMGLLKSFLFALLCVMITGGLNRIGIRLKL